MNDVRLYVLAGPANVGKGTILDRLKEADGGDDFVVVSTSALLKEVRKLDTEIGRQVAYYMDNALLAPDEVVNEAVEGYVAGLAKAGVKRIILDGYSRNAAQAKYMLEHDMRPARVIELTLPLEELVARGLDRVCCKKCGRTYSKTNPARKPKVDGICDEEGCGGELVKRKDDTQPKIVQRYESYQSETYPMFDVFKNAGINVVVIDNLRDDALELFRTAIDM